MATVPDIRDHVSRPRRGKPPRGKKPSSIEGSSMTFAIYLIGILVFTGGKDPS
jgi:hypothetical protein